MLTLAAMALLILGAVLTTVSLVLRRSSNVRTSTLVADRLDRRAFWVLLAGTTLVVASVLR